MRNKAAAEGQLGFGAAYMSPSPPPQHAPDAEVARRRAYAGEGGAALLDPHRRDSADAGASDPMHR